LERSALEEPGRLAVVGGAADGGCGEGGLLAFNDDTALALDQDRRAADQTRC
jgi:hypothetical protein